MLINCFILAISSSIDSLGIGVTYGIKDKKISFSSTIILFIISLLVSFISVFFGKILLGFLLLLNLFLKKNLGIKMILILIIRI